MSDVSAERLRRRLGLCPHLTLTTSQLSLWAWVRFLETSGEMEEQQEPRGPMPGFPVGEGAESPWYSLAGCYRSASGEDGEERGA